MTDTVTGENLIEQLRQSMQIIIDKTGPNSNFAQEMLQKIDKLQSKLDMLSEPDKIVFMREMKGSFKNAIERIGNRLTQYNNFEQVYSSSIVVAVVFSIFLIFALFGYKLYKSLSEEELKKREKLKNRLLKKAKKSN